MAIIFIVSSRFSHDSEACASELPENLLSYSKWSKNPKNMTIDICIVIIRMEKLSLSNSQ